MDRRDFEGTVADDGEGGLVEHVLRTSGGWDGARWARLLGAANAFKEGDASAGLAAADEAERARARSLLAATRLRDVDAHPPLDDATWRAL